MVAPRAVVFRPLVKENEDSGNEIEASSAWHSRRAEIGLQALCTVPFTAEAGAKHPFKRQLHTTHVLTLHLKAKMAPMTGM